MIESNLSKSSEYNWLKTMINKGYETILYFLCTNDIDINKNRVVKRVKEGGHSVPESIIVHRYQMGLTYLKSGILIFKEAYLIDNSEETSKVMAVLKEGSIIQKEENSPIWINEVLFIAMR